MTVVKNTDGTVTLQFGGCTMETLNSIPVTQGWNYVIRLYRPRQEVLDGTWKAPVAESL